MCARCPTRSPSGLKPRVSHGWRGRLAEDGRAGRHLACGDGRIAVRVRRPCGREACTSTSRTRCLRGGGRTLFHGGAQEGAGEKPRASLVAVAVVDQRVGDMGVYAALPLLFKTRCLRLSITSKIPSGLRSMRVMRSTRLVPSSSQSHRRERPCESLTNQINRRSSPFG
jgi:hypothetical protein